MQIEIEWDTVKVMNIKKAVSEAAEILVAHTNEIEKVRKTRESFDRYIHGEYGNYLLTIQAP